MASAHTRIDPAEGHRLWAERYDVDLNPLLALEQRVLRPHLDRLKGKLVVDVGCGTGRGMLLAHNAEARVLGLDLTPEMLKQAAAKPGLQGRLVCADAQDLPVTNEAADVALSSFCASYVEDLRAVFAELARVTRPCGRIVVSDIHPAAMATGWKRTFRNAGVVYEMDLHSAHPKNPLRVGLQAGLTLCGVLEPRFGQAERPLFEKAGTAADFETVAAIPALLITFWERQSR